MGEALSDLGRTTQRRIRLVAYGARLESVLGESPRGFESPILRQENSAVVLPMRPKPQREYPVHGECS
jgi:hypothetical protein